MSPPDQTLRPGFWALLTSQSLGAFNDNVLKMLVSLLAVQAAGAGQTGAYLSLASAVFMAPYLLFSGYAGSVADRFGKRSVLIVGKVAEVAIMVGALAALASGRMDFLFVALFVLAAQATFFSPAKSGILPEMLPATALPNANGLLEMSRYAAVIMGTVVGGVALQLWGDQPGAIGAVLVGIAVVGALATLGVSRTAPPRRSTAEFSWNPWRGVAAGVREVVRQPQLRSVVILLSYFEFLAALFLLDMILVGKETMGLDDARVGIMGAAAGIGIALGCVTAGRWSRGQLVLSMVPIGFFGVAAGLVLCAGATTSYGLTTLGLLVTGVAGGFVVVPLNAALQSRSTDGQRGLALSTNNFLNMAAVLAASSLLWLLRDLLEIDPRAILVVASLGTVAVTVVGLATLPEYRPALPFKLAAKMAARLSAMTIW